MKILPHYLLASVLLLALTFAAPANACQLVCQVTMARSTGNMGGYAGADAICNAEFPGFRFARSHYVAAKGAPTERRAYSVTGQISQYLPTHQTMTGWVGPGWYAIDGVNQAIFWSGVVGGAPLVAWQGCADTNGDMWKSASTAKYGAVYAQPAEGATVISNGFKSDVPENTVGHVITSCEKELPLLCCNM